MHENGYTYTGPNAISALTVGEIRRLQTGFERMNEKQERRAKRGGQGSTDPTRESKLRREEEALKQINERHSED